MSDASTATGNRPTPSDASPATGNGPTPSDASPATGNRPTRTFRGSLAAIFVTPSGGAPMEAVDEIEAVAGMGLEGDRYANGAGTFWEEGRPWGQVTLVEAEAVEAARATGVEIDDADTRRNLLTEGVPLNHLVDREFQVGEVTLRGVKLCEPCTHIEKLSGNPIRRPLVHRGGLNAVIVSGGTLRVSDPIVPREEEA